MKKIALILHGYPGLAPGEIKLKSYLEEIGYTVIIPDLFSEKFIFSPENIVREVNIQTKNNPFKVGFGVSLGGLILPYFAKDNPDMKMVFIASGPNIKTDLKLFNFIIFLAETPFVLGLFAFIVRKLPQKILNSLYKTINPFRGPGHLVSDYEKDMRDNIVKIRNLGKTKQAEILEYIIKEDNTKRLMNLKNETVIFSGDNDMLMPKRGSLKLKRLLINSRLIVNKGSHLNVIGSLEMNQLLKFINTVC